MGEIWSVHLTLILITTAVIVLFGYLAAELSPGGGRQHPARESSRRDDV